MVGVASFANQTTISILGAIVAVMTIVYSALILKGARDKLKAMPPTDPTMAAVKRVYHMSVAVLVISVVALALMAFIYFGAAQAISRTGAWQRLAAFMTPESAGATPLGGGY